MIYEFIVYLNIYYLYFLNLLNLIDNALSCIYCVLCRISLQYYIALQTTLQCNAMQCNAM